MRKTIDDYSFYIDTNETNPINCAANLAVDELTTNLHPVYGLSTEVIIKILTWLVNWILSDCKIVKQKIDECTKQIGRKSQHVVISILKQIFSPIGVDRNGQKIWHSGLDPRIFVQSSENELMFKSLTNSLEDLELYCTKLWPMGPEWHLLQHLKEKVIVPIKAHNEKMLQEKLERLEQEQLAEKAFQLKERKRLEEEERKRLLALNGPRKSGRNTQRIAYVDSSTSSFEDDQDSGSETVSEDQVTEEEDPLVGRRKRRTSIVQSDDDDEVSEVSESESRVTDENSINEYNELKENRRAKQSKQPRLRTSARLSGTALEYIN